MDRSAAKAIVDRSIGPLMSRLGIGHWRITVDYVNEPPDDDGWQHRGDCAAAPDYNKALISLNPDAFEDEDDLLATLRHELFHVLLSPFDLAQQAVQPILDADETTAKVIERVWTHAEEQAVINLERMHRGLTSE